MSGVDVIRADTVGSMLRLDWLKRAREDSAAGVISRTDLSGRRTARPKLRLVVEVAEQAWA